MAVGRPRDSSVERKVLGATRALLAERGYAGLRIDEVAARSGVAKTTIYRRWPTLAHLVVAAMVELIGERDLTPVGDPEQDLRKACRSGLVSLRQAGPGVAALALEVHRQADDELRRAYRAAVIDPVREAIAAAIRRGQSAGTFRADAEPYVTTDALVGAAVYRLVILHESPDEGDLDALLDVLLAGLMPG
ncbi:MULTISPECIES: TetR/AcrR family transcriptional regulator [unclassified Luteococcus]|uniref:TetR/AcrR family transcriptional regulator n=1 Tax=unclassified Luteococcus TaxID=2639923 RepID=UPI00313E47B9